MVVKDQLKWKEEKIKILKETLYSWVTLQVKSYHSNHILWFKLELYIAALLGYSSYNFNFSVHLYEHCFEIIHGSDGLCLWCLSINPSHYNMIGLDFLGNLTLFVTNEVRI